MALRRTAERVGTQMDLYRSEHAVAPTWPARERLIVCVGPSPYAGRLVRATRRMAASLKAPWIAVHVETPDDARMSEADRDRLASTMQLAEQLGGQTATISGHDVADELIRYARSRNVTRIVVGKPKQSRWSEWFRRPLVYELTRICGDIDVYVISGDPQPGPPAPPRTAPRALPRLDYLWAVLVIGLCTAISAVLSPLFHPTNLVMVYLLGVVIVSLRFGRGPSIFASVLAVATFDFLFVPPRLTFAVADTQYLLTFAVMLMTGLVISTLVARVRFQADSARGRERSTAALYLPLAGSRQAAGVLGVLPAQGRASIDLEQQHLLQTFADLVALAIQRAELAAEAERIRLGMETERLRSSLLSAVSHDLRTPLSAITGAGSTLLDSDTSLDRSVQRELASSILKESERLNRLVANLLDMTRLQAGALEVHKEWQPVEEVIGASLERLARQLKDRPLSTHIAPDLPFVPLDDLLIQQVLVNLLENAVRHTPAGTPIELTATAETDAVAIEVADRGSGLPDPPGRLFEMFYRPASGNARSGTGLGLAICRGIVELHGGKIEAAKRPDGGAVFRFRLPVQGRSPGAIGESLTKEPVEQ
jgi:K+-sensing histidine kinase KdpD